MKFVGATDTMNFFDQKSKTLVEIPFDAWYESVVYMESGKSKKEKPAAAVESVIPKPASQDGILGDECLYVWADRVGKVWDVEKVREVFMADPKSKKSQILLAAFAFHRKRDYTVKQIISKLRLHNVGPVYRTSLALEDYWDDVIGRLKVLFGIYKQPHSSEARRQVDDYLASLGCKKWSDYNGQPSSLVNTAKVSKVNA